MRDTIDRIFAWVAGVTSMYWALQWWVSPSAEHWCLAWGALALMFCQLRILDLSKRIAHAQGD